MNLLSFNKTNPNLTLIPFKEHKNTSSGTQKNTNPFKKKKKKKYLQRNKEKKKELPRCEKKN